MDRPARPLGSHVITAALIFFALLLMVLRVPDIAAAYNFGPYFTNNYYQQHIYRWLTTPFTSAANYVRANESAVTDMELVYQSNYDYAEVRHYDYHYGSDFPAAVTDCMRVDSSEICGRFRIRYNLSKAGSTQEYYDHVACHEMGHAVGLRHFNAGDPLENYGCMGHDWRHWSAHSRDHVNARY